MTPKDLNSDELLCLVALAKLIIQADEQLTSGEREGLKSLGAVVGVEAFKHAILEAQRRCASVTDAQTLAETITRPAARECIFEELSQLAARDELLDEEQDILDWLSDAWSLDSPG